MDVREVLKVAKAMKEKIKEVEDKTMYGNHYTRHLYVYSTGLNALEEMADILTAMAKASIKREKMQVNNEHVADAIETYNNEVKVLAEILPIDSPIKAVQWLKIEQLEANDYNPNSVAPPEMKLLKTSILADGYTQPIVVIHDKERDVYVIVDGFHRYRCLKEDPKIAEMTKGYAPCVIIDKPIDDRMASTIRHNRARGTHSVDGMTDMVVALKTNEKSDKWLADNLGMDEQEIYALKRVSGLSDMFKGGEFSRSWVARENNR